MNVYRRCAYKMIRHLGYVAAKERSQQLLENNYQGTASHSFHNAVHRHIIDAATAGYTTKELEQR